MVQRIALILGLLLGGWSAASAGPPARPLPVLHLQAPSADAARRFDPFQGEAALRLLRLVLEHETRLSARYHPVDADGIEDLYPRLELVYSAPAPANFVRLQRKGDSVRTFSSSDGREWHEVGRWPADELPERARVGLWIDHARDANRLDAKIEILEFCGGSLDDAQLREVGRPKKPTTLQRDGRAWTFSGSGETDNMAYVARPPAGAFVPTAVTGDFTLTAAVRSIDSDSDRAWAGIAVRAGDKPESAWVGIGKTTGDIAMRCKADGMGHAAGMPEPTRVTITPRLHLGKDHKDDLTPVTIDATTWQQTTGGIVRLQESILAEVQAYYPLHPKRRAELSTPDACQNAALRAARRAAMSLKSADIFDASRMVDRVLARSPQSESGHRASAFCSSLLVMLDPYGLFQDRRLVAAGAMASHLYARRLGNAVSLDGAWVRLAIGFPAAAMETMARVPESAGDAPQRRAIEMFATRDCTRLSPATIKKAGPLEQLAWLWAAEHCGRRSLLGEMNAELAVANRNPAFLPQQRFPYYLSARTCSELGVRLASARAVQDLLSDGRFDRKARQDLAMRLAKLLKMAPPEATLSDAAIRRMAWAVSNCSPAQSSQLLEALTELFYLPPAAEEQNVHAIGLSEYLALRRATWARVLLARARYLHGLWNNYEQAAEFGRRVWKALHARMPGPATLFRAMELDDRDQDQACRELMGELWKTAFSRDEAVAWLALDLLGNPAFPGRRMSAASRAECGSWRASLTVERLRQLRLTPEAQAAGLRIWRIDPWNKLPQAVFVFVHLSTAHFRDVHQRMRYSAAHRCQLSRSVFFHMDQPELAKRMLWSVADDLPDEVDPLADLARYNRLTADWDQVAAVARRARRHLPFSIAVGNMYGRMAADIAMEGYPQLALELGRKAAAGGTAKGRIGYGWALEANGRPEEARRQFLRIMKTWPGSYRSYLGFVIRNEPTDREILDTVQMLIDDGADPSVVWSRTLDYAIRYGLDDAVWDKLIDQVPPAHMRVSVVLKDRLAKMLAEGQWYAALKFIETRGKDLDQYRFSVDYAEVFALDVLGRPVMARTAAERILPDAVMSRPSLLYQMGRIDEAQLRRRSVWEGQKLRMHWSLAMLAEARGNPIRARKHYQLVSHYGDRYHLYVQAARGAAWRLRKTVLQLKQRDRSAVSAPAE